MIRVYFDDREPVDVEANNCAVGAAGELVLNHAEVVTTTHPQTFRPVSVVESLTWVRTYGAASRWLYAEPVKDDDNRTDPAALQEVYR